MSKLRVIAGSVRGRKLKSVPGKNTRPITDRTKESLFNIIGPEIINASVLDLFAGTGSVGIEALSRGAKYVRFIEINRKASTIIRQNLEITGFLEHTDQHADLITGDAFKIISQETDRSFDIIYIAPPQYKNLWLKALSSIDKNIGWLNSDSWVIIQIHPVEYKITELKHLIETDQRKYGSTLLIFYEVRS